MDTDGNGKIDISEFEAAFAASMPQHVRASVDEPRLPLLPKLRDEPHTVDGNGGSSSRRSARQVVAEMAVQVPSRSCPSVVIHSQVLNYFIQVCILPDEDPVAAFGRRITEIFRQGEERVMRGLEAADAQVFRKMLFCLRFFKPLKFAL
jgi:hypothetical protein